MKYKTNFLKNVILRLDFDKIELGKLKPFLEKYKTTFPDIEEKKGEQGLINFNFKTKELQQDLAPISTWVLYNSGKTKKIQIEPNSLIIEYLSYSDSTELLSDTSIAAEFIKEFKIKTINRLGLRYVNEIKIDNGDVLDWGDYINDDLLGSINFSQKNTLGLTRAMSILSFKKDFGNINFNFGMWNSSYPNIISEKTFILDIDAYSKFPLDTEDIKLDEIIKEFNHGIESIFENSIKDNLRSILNE